MLAKKPCRMSRASGFICSIEFGAWDTGGNGIKSSFLDRLGQRDKASLNLLQTRGKYCGAGVDVAAP